VVTPKRRVRLIGPVVGLVALVLLVVLITRCGPHPAPKPHASPSPVATVTASTRPSSSPTLRPPQPVITAPTTATPCAACFGEGKG
jgi:hypothetical protein